MTVTRRNFIKSTTVLAAGAALDGAALLRANERKQDRPLTQFQIACMTLPYSAFPLERALRGIKNAGYEYVAWGLSHREDGKNVPTLASDAPPEKAKELAKRCRDMGLDPLMMFSDIYPDAENGLDMLKHRLKQASAAGIPQLLTFGNIKSSNLNLWIERFKVLGPIARDSGVLLVVKQHGGNTGTGAVCAEIIREVDDDGVKVCYDAGNVLYYLSVDPLPDFKTCADEVRSFCIKDHRSFPKAGICGPGLGEVDHYKLLHPVAFTGRKMPLCCENIFAPCLPRPTKPEDIDVLAKRAREFLELVTQGLQV